MGRRYPYDPSAKYSEEGVRDQDRGRLTNTRVAGISKDEKREESKWRDQS